MEEIKKIEVQGTQYGVADMLMRSVMGGNAQVIEWSHTHNMNDYKDAGTYRIKGERTGNPLEDNLPIMNQGSGHTIEGILYVLDSSLTNGSGKQDDCTITQFLMLSNRVGGQEGDMYMRSAYGANKDSLTWKPWEKYQTNMEVGAMTNLFTLNPLNPTQVIGRVGMNKITDNGIYSGVYVPPKVYAGTSYTPTIEINDPTAIETFVMIVINNYSSAKDARCVTQIKFAVTNGGVFSMEKRSTIPGTTNVWSQWETIGGGGGLHENISFNLDSGNKYYFGAGNAMNLTIGSGVALGEGVKIGRSVGIGDDVSINTLPQKDGKPSGVELTYDIQIGANTIIGKNIKIDDNLQFTNVEWTSESDMNDFKTPGVYNIYGERTRQNDNLPILNASTGHSIAARLIVVASTLQPANNEICITQFLMLSNRKGGDGNMYVRTYNENNSPAPDWWTPWQKLQGVREGYIFTDTIQVNPDGGVQQIEGVTGLNNMVDNGIYSGIYTDDPTFQAPTFIDTFTLIVINNYAVAGKDERLKRTISQLKYAVDAITNQATIKKRTKTDGDDKWSDWTDIGGGSNEVDVTDAINTYGLPTLVAQGLVKEGIVYKVTCDAGETPVLDTGNKIKNYITTSSGNFDDKATFEIFTNKIDGYNTFFIDCYVSGATAEYYKFIVTDLNSPIEKVKVSVDMEELPSTINFTINGDVYTVKRDTTWGEAIYKYKNIGSKFTMSSSKQVSNLSGMPLYLNNEFVYGWDFIRENDAYTCNEGDSGD